MPPLPKTVDWVVSRVDLDQFDSADLLDELSRTRLEIRRANSRALTLIGDLKDMWRKVGVVPHFEYGLGEYDFVNLESLQRAWDEERKRGLELEKTMCAVQGECENPDVVPAILLAMGIVGSNDASKIAKQL